MQPDVKTKNASRQIIQRKYQFYEESLKDKICLLYTSDAADE